VDDIMKFKYIKLNLNATKLIAIVFCIFMLGSCGGDYSSPGDPASGTLSFKCAASLIMAPFSKKMG
jgi:hypothetical protein